MQILLVLSIGLCLVALSGCQSELLTMRDESSRMELSIPEKQRRLAELEEQNRNLAQEKQRLIAALDSKSTTLNDLSAKLADLRQQNSRMKTLNDVQLKKKREAESKLQQYQSQLSALQNDNQPPDEAKKKKIEALKKEIKTYLELGLKEK